MILLAVDTALDACAAAVLVEENGEERLFGETEVIGRGHAERLMGVIDRVIAAAAIRLAEVDVFAASIGPGSFTGIRVGVAAVRGFAVATGHPAIGVSSLDALATEAAAAVSGRPVVAVLDARKDEVYARPYDAGLAPLDAPKVLSRAAAATLAGGLGAVVIGSGAALLTAIDPSLTVAADRPFAAIETFARLARRRGGAAARPRPVPLYVRPPDARPQASHRLARLVPGPIGGT
jgi:tRNA threonylcarbamoyl adenosine modification protein YeaZ